MADNKFLFVVVLLGAVTAAGWLLRKAGVMKPDEEVKPWWAYLRWRLIMLGIVALAGTFYLLLDDFTA